MSFVELETSNFVFDEFLILIDNYFLKYVAVFLKENIYEIWQQVILNLLDKHLIFFKIVLKLGGIYLFLFDT